MGEIPGITLRKEDHRRHFPECKTGGSCLNRIKQDNSGNSASLTWHLLRPGLGGGPQGPQPWAGPRPCAQGVLQDASGSADPAQVTAASQQPGRVLRPPPSEGPGSGAPPARGACAVITPFSALLFFGWFLKLGFSQKLGAPLDFIQVTDHRGFLGAVHPSDSCLKPPSHFVDITAPPPSPRWSQRRSARTGSLGSHGAGQLAGAPTASRERDKTRSLRGTANLHQVPKVAPPNSPSRPPERREVGEEGVLLLLAL